MQPLIFGKDSFDELAMLHDRDDVEHRFRSLVYRELHPFLNSLAPFKDIQRIRDRRKQARFPDAFGTFACQPRHWYSFNHGGRNELQFNVGMSPTRLRFGLGLEFGLGKGGKPDRVRAFHLGLTRYIYDDSRRFEELINEHEMAGELAAVGGGFETIPTPQLSQQILQPRKDPGWLFFGKILETDSDMDLLESTARLMTAFDEVFTALRPVWEGAHRRAPSF
jgi:hypothetical protein